MKGPAHSEERDKWQIGEEERGERIEGDLIRKSFIPTKAGKLSCGEQVDKHRRARTTHYVPRVESAKP